MSDPALSASAQNAMKLLHALWKRTKDTRGRLHKLLEVVIDLSPDQTDTPRWEYYCIMHMQRELFWLEHTVRETFINTVNDTSANDFIGWESAPHIRSYLYRISWCDADDEHLHALRGRAPYSLLVILASMVEK
jgi:hypothetical protein